MLNMQGTAREITTQPIYAELLSLRPFVNEDGWQLLAREGVLEVVKAILNVTPNNITIKDDKTNDATRITATVGAYEVHVSLKPFGTEGLVSGIVSTFSPYPSHFGNKFLIGEAPKATYERECKRRGTIEDFTGLMNLTARCGKPQPASAPLPPASLS